MMQTLPRTYSSRQKIHTAVQLTCDQHMIYNLNFMGLKRFWSRKQDDPCNDFWTNQFFVLIPLTKGSNTFFGQIGTLFDLKNSTLSWWILSYTFWVLANSQAFIKRIFVGIPGVSPKNKNTLKNDPWTEKSLPSLAQNTTFFCRNTKGFESLERGTGLLEEESEKKQNQVNLCVI